MVKKYSRLAKSDGVWRVDGVGEVTGNGPIGSRVYVHFSQLNETEGLKNPYWKTSRTDVKPLALKLHPATLRDFRVGTLWRGGKRIAGEIGPKQFTLNVRDVRVVRLNEPIVLEGMKLPTLLPESAYCLEEENRNALKPALYAFAPIKCSDNTTWAIIPCAEIWRFYCGVSSRFLSGSLRGRLEDYVDWNKCGIVDDSPIVHLKRPLSKKEIAVLGRAVMSPVAKESLMTPYKYLAMLKIKEQEESTVPKPTPVIKAAFPFEDSTTLTATGKKFLLATINGRQHWVYFAMVLQSCNHDFGYKNITIQHEKWPEGWDGPKSPTDGGTRPPEYEPVLEEEDELSIIEAPADARLRRLVVQPQTNQFPGMNRIGYTHVRPKGDKPNGRPGSSTEIPIDGLTQDDGNYTEDGKGNLGVSDFSSKIVDVARDLKQFLAVIEQMKSNLRAKDWVINTRANSNGLIHDNHFVCQFPAKIKGLRNWHLVDENGAVRARHVVWAEVHVKSNSCYFYLLEMELKKESTEAQCTIILFAKDFARMEDKDLDELLVLTAIQKRWPDPRTNKWKEPKDGERALKFASRFITLRVHHPHQSKVSIDGGKCKVKTQVDPKAWSEMLHDRIEEDVPFSVANSTIAT